MKPKMSFPFEGFAPSGSLLDIKTYLGNEDGPAFSNENGI